MYGGGIYGGIEYGGILSGGVLTISVSDTVNDTDFVTIVAPVPTLIINCLNPLQGFWAEGLVIVGP